MIYQIIQPHPTLKPFVKEYMLLHFNFSGPHTFLVLSETGKLFFQTNPSGKTEAFFKKLSELGPTASLDDVQKPTLRMI